MKLKNLLSIFFKKENAENKLPLEDFIEVKNETDFELKNLSLLIGNTIKEIKIFFEPQGENGWLDYNLAFIY